ncbi:hypothetical protein [Haploplasma axanthum]|uniref:Uncharacterized protein n=1 Tax=Haploplasma axanthum TaxID=29552 RepID=A0A449BBG8_HAPAX|nr:hypothetical protein [Haploplasma axanthum]VEU79757.1 Uncharacterised protein [Haploplasma axanthum]
MKKDLSKIVIPIRDSNYADSRDFIDAPIYDKNIENEEKVCETPACFLGAWYRKVFSSKDTWLGIEGTITLGEFIPDQARFGNDKRVYFDRFLDNPSVYMGGHSLSESDAGLGFNSGYRFKGDEEELNYGTPKIAYRPFWRYIYSDCLDVNGNVTRNNVNSWNVANPHDFDFYYFPGDKIKMAVYSPINDYLQLRIELIEETTNEKYVKIREGFKLKDKPRVFYSPLFYSEGHGSNKAEFKRVNSIDQYGNEGFIVKETEAKVTEAVWENTYLFRRIEGMVCRVPMTENRKVEMACPNKESFKIKKLNNGGESITITPFVDEKLKER